MRRSSLGVWATLSFGLCFGQQIITCGDGSYASYVPWSKSRTIDTEGKKGRGGDQSRFMESRKLYVEEKKGRPLPTNDWWTNILTHQYTGALWAYPVLARASAQGVTISYPSYWIDNGTEMKARSSVTIGGEGFSPESAVATSWHDWDVEFKMEAADGKAFFVTLAHGMPYVWIETRNVSATVTATAENGKVETLAKKGAHEILKAGDDLYGITRGRNFIVVSLLPSAEKSAELLEHATAIPRETRVDWKYDAVAGVVKTVWTVKAEDLAGKTENPEVLQGFQPHHFRKTTPKFGFIPGAVYPTPRGELKLAKGNALEIDYPFPGMVPYWPAPGGKTFRPEVMDALVRDYAEKGQYGNDTYWGGKGLLQMAFAMMAARERRDAMAYKTAHDSLRAAFENWLTWTPGEKEKYFAFAPRWGGLIGVNSSYDSETFNDHHFHYGYFTYSGALLCLVDEDFKKRFGPMLELIARDYANWERGHEKFPFFRTFDPWAGHSFAGGMGDGAGNGQESSSEAMQGWGGLFWLGVALGNDAMRDAGLFGYVSEARGTAEYWFDRDRKNIDYTKYAHPYCCNLTCHGVGWWTYFSGDPVWMHAIQWLPSTPILDYLSEDKEFAKWDFDQMWERKQISGWDGELGDASLGNVILSYWQRSDPEAAGKKFDELWDANRKVAHNPDTAHMSYWQIQAHLDLGDVDNSVHADVPWARAYRNAKRTLVGYNPTSEKKEVRFYDAHGKVVGTLVAEPRRLSVSGRASKALAPFAVAPRKSSVVLADVSLPDLARGKKPVVSSEENPGLTAGKMTDDDPNSRWATSYDDTERTAWIDLGEPCKIYAVEFDWEHAHASKFELFWGDDGQRWKSAGRYAGVQGLQRLAFSGETARYVKMKALEKSLPQYGVSLFRFSVFGCKAALPPGAPMGLRIVSEKPVLKEGAVNTLRVETWHGGTVFKKVSKPQFASKDGRFTEAGFIPETTEAAKIVARVDGMTVERIFPVEEQLVPVKLEVNPKRAETVVGEPFKLGLKAISQFGTEMSLEDLKTAVRGPEGGVISKGEFVATRPGDYAILFTLGKLSAHAEVKAVNEGEVNLARLATVTASGEENGGTLVKFIADGDPKTRWGSAHTDGEWVKFDFGKERMVREAKIHWENARAEHYRIEISKDGATWSTVADVPQAKDGKESVSWKPVKARYVKLTGLSRNTNYGISIFEMEIR